ncbi:MAG: hypothetical protein Q4C50_06615 [Eubacteriales bacterium]|nr:hypothetical protein [Eubacteriales bacterium]
MDKNSVMYQLMDLRLNESFNAAILADEEYMTITKHSGEYLEKLDAMQLSKDARELIDRYVSEQNALGVLIVFPFPGKHQIHIRLFPDSSSIEEF